jgi:hypothetical protein
MLLKLLLNVKIVNRITPVALILKSIGQIYSFYIVAKSQDNCLIIY